MRRGWNGLGLELGFGVLHLGDRDGRPHWALPASPTKKFGYHLLR